MASICAVIVTFFPDRSLSDNVAALLPQVDCVVIVDNGSGRAGRDLFHQWVGSPKIHCLLNEENLGLGTALNQGVRYALGQGYTWIATFDQDSRVTPDYFPEMLRAYASFPNHERVAIVSPLLRSQDTGTLVSFAAPRPTSADSPASAAVEVRVAVTSGSLILARVFEEAGCFREDFFIEFVDFEFCLRCRRRGWTVLEARDAVLDHRFGQPTRHRFLWRRPVTYNHSAARRFYKWRNRLLVYREYLFFDPAWAWSDLRYAIRELTLTVMFEGDVFRKLFNTGKGLCYGLAGIKGPLPKE